MHDKSSGRQLTRRRLLVTAAGAAAATLPTWRLTPAFAESPADVRLALTALVGAFAHVSINPIDPASADVTAARPSTLQHGNAVRVLEAVHRMRLKPEFRNAVAAGPAATLQVLRRSLFPKGPQTITVAEFTEIGEAFRKSIAVQSQATSEPALPSDPDQAAAAFFSGRFATPFGSADKANQTIRDGEANKAASSLAVDAASIVPIIAPPVLERFDYVIAERA